MIKQFSIWLMTACLVSSLMAPASYVSAGTIKSDFTLNTQNSGSISGNYEDGQVLVTIAAPKDTPLTREGDVSFDSHLTVDESWNFGDADVLADTPVEEEFMEDKTLYVVKVSSEDYSTEKMLTKLEDQAYVISAEPDYYMEKMSVSNDPYADYQWYLGSSDKFSSSTAEGIHYADYAQTENHAPIAAVVDTGVDYTHPDLAGHMWKNPYSGLSGTYGYDYGSNDSDPMDEDEDGHGTHCAGVIGAANNNNTGITGVATNVQIMALKVFDSNGRCTTSNVAGAFNYIYTAQSLGANIATINCSWGGSSTTTSMRTLIEKIGEKGALFVFASGNDDVNHDQSQTNICPYDLNSSYAVVVGASTPDDTKASYSDYGAGSVDLFAPGHQILSTINKDTFYPGIYTDEQRASLTSFYTDFSDQNTLFVTADQIEKDDSLSVHYKGIEHSNADFFNRSSGSDEISFSSAYTNSNLLIYVDVTSLNLDKTAEYYVGLDIGMVSSGELRWAHSTFLRSNSIGSFTVYNDHTYLMVMGLEGNLSKISSVFIDNVGISKANPDTSQFGRYNIYDGTSMAAPSVTGAVAVLANTYPSDSAIQRRERLLTCIRQTSGVTGYCKTGGILDLSKIPTATYTTETQTKTTTTSSTKKTTKVKVKKIKLNKKKATLRYKKKLKLKATVTPKKATNKKVKWYVSNKKYAKVTQKGVVTAKKKGIGHTVKVYAKAKDGSKKKAYCKVTIKKAKK